MDRSYTPPARRNQSPTFVLLLTAHCPLPTAHLNSGGAEIAQRDLLVMLKRG